MVEATGPDTIYIGTDQEDAEVTVIVKEYADFGAATEIESAATYGGPGDNPNLSTYTSALTASAPGEMFIAAIVLPQDNIATLDAGAGWSNLTDVKLSSFRVGIEEITVPSGTVNADFTTTGLSFPGWHGLWIRLSSPAPVTSTGSAGVSIGPATFSGSAGFKLEFTGSLSRTISGATFTASGATTAPIFSSSMAHTVAGALISASGTTAAPIFSGSMAHSLGGAILTASATSTAPVYTASASITLGATGLTGSGHTGTPAFIASMSKSLAGVSFSGSGFTTRPTFTGSFAVIMAGATISSTGTTTAPTFTASTAISLGGATFAGSAATTAGSFNVAWSVVPQQVIEMKRNTANQIVSLHLTNRGNGSDVISGDTTVYVTLDGGTQTAGAGTIEHEGNGEWSYRPTKAETNGDYISFTFTNASAVTQTVSVSTTAGPVSPSEDVNYINTFITVRDESGVPWPSGVLNHQIVGVDPGFGGAYDDDQQQSTANNLGVVTITFPRGVYVRYWQPGGRYRTAHLTDALADPYALPSITG